STLHEVGNEVAPPDSRLLIGRQIGMPKTICHARRIQNSVQSKLIGAPLKGLENPNDRALLGNVVPGSASLENGG
ncbi:MAG: hypothetical protein KKB37_14060, partial [Alphaproteobacteria bacterium]|nr:hypothetical protein [Alphaproteobacteria bacterium]